MYTRIDALNDYISECKMKIMLSGTSFSVSKESRLAYVWWYEQAIESCKARIAELQKNPLI